MLSVQAIIMEHPQRSLLAKHWELDPDCVFLNHGSFGATPTHIRNEQRGWMNLLEEEPVRFFEDLAEGFMKNSRLALAKMLHCDAGDLALIENATSGVNTILARWCSTKAMKYSSQTTLTRPAAIPLILLLSVGKQRLLRSISRSRLRALMLRLMPLWLA